MKIAARQQGRDKGPRLTRPYESASVRRGERRVSRRRRDPRGEEPGKDACQEHAVEGAGPADGDYGSAELSDALRACPWIVDLAVVSRPPTCLFAGLWREAFLAVSGFPERTQQAGELHRD